MNNHFFPALLVGEFSDACSAFASLGIADNEAKILAAEANEAHRQGGGYVVEIADIDGAETNAVLVLAPIECARTRLCIGYPGLAAESEDAALTRATLGLLSHLVDNDIDPPVLYVYRLNIVRSTLH